MLREAFGSSELVIFGTDTTGERPEALQIPPSIPFGQPAPLLESSTIIHLPPSSPFLSESSQHKSIPVYRHLPGERLSQKIGEIDIEEFREELEKQRLIQPIQHPTETRRSVLNKLRCGFVNPNLLTDSQLRQSAQKALSELGINHESPVKEEGKLDVLNDHRQRRWVAKLINEFGVSPQVAEAYLKIVLSNDKYIVSPKNRSEQKKDGVRNRKPKDVVRKLGNFPILNVRDYHTDRNPKEKPDHRQEQKEKDSPSVMEIGETQRKWVDQKLESYPYSSKTSKVIVLDVPEKEGQKILILPDGFRIVRISLKQGEQMINRLKEILAEDAVRTNDMKRTSLSSFRSENLPHMLAALGCQIQENGEITGPGELMPIIDVLRKSLRLSSKEP